MEGQAVTEEAESAEYRVPRWFVGFASFVLAAAIPWGCWVTHTLVALSVRSQLRTEMSVQIDSRLSAAETNLSDHLSQLSAVVARLQVVENRLDRLEDRITE